MSHTKEVLIIDTSYGLTVGVVGHEPLYEADSRSHVEKIEPFIAAAISQAGLQPQQIGTLVVGVGPAPFTGLRAGIVSAKAFAFAIGAKILGQDILEPQARWVASELGKDAEPCLLLSVNDARRQQLYFQLFVLNSDIAHSPKANGRQAARVDALGKMDIQYPHDLVQTVLHQAEGSGGGEMHKLIIVGHGAQKYSEAWREFNDKGMMVQLRDESVVHSAGAHGVEIFAQTALDRQNQGEAMSADPLYLRRPDVSIPGPLKAVTM